MSNHFSQPSPSGERDSERSSQGEGLSRRGATPEVLLGRARALRTGQTDAEERLWQKLRASRFQGLKFRRQVAFSGNYIADFVCASRKLVIELDGSQHAEQSTYDNRRTHFFEQQGYRVVRFWNGDVLANLTGVLETILAAVSHPLPGASHLSLPPEGEGIE